LINNAILWAPKLLGSILIFAAFYLTSKVVKKIIRRAGERFNFADSITSLIIRTSNVTLIIFGLITALGTIGVNVSALAAGIGLTGFALGFALKDTIANLLSGVLILLYRPFETGDHIKIAGYEGRVISIDLRYTKLDSEERKILIPNSKLFTDPITVVRSNANGADEVED